MRRNAFLNSRQLEQFVAVGMGGSGFGEMVSFLFPSQRAYHTTAAHNHMTSEGRFALSLRMISKGAHKENNTTPTEHQQHCVSVNEQGRGRANYRETEG